MAPLTSLLKGLAKRMLHASDHVLNTKSNALLAGIHVNRTFLLNPKDIEDARADFEFTITLGLHLEV